MNRSLPLLPLAALLLAGILVAGCPSGPPQKTDQTGAGAESGGLMAPPGSRTASVSLAPQGQARIASFNIKWFSLDGKEARSSAQVKEIADVIKDVDAPLFGLQEIGDKESLVALARYLPGYKWVMGPSGGQQHCAILWDSRRASIRDVTEWQEMNEGQEKRRDSLRDPLVARAQIGKFDFLFVVLHSKAMFDAGAIRTRRNQFGTLRGLLDAHLAQSADKDVVVVGDMNDFVGSDALKELTGKKRGASGTGGYTIADGTLPETKVTYMSRSGRIDHIIVTSQPLPQQEWSGAGGVDTYPKPKGADRKAYENNVSDHLPIWATFDVSQDRD